MKNNTIQRLLFLVLVVLFLSCTKDDLSLNEPVTAKVVLQEHPLVSQLSSTLFAGGYAANQIANQMEFTDFNLYFAPGGILKISDSGIQLNGSWSLTKVNIVTGTYALTDEIQVNFSGYLETNQNDKQSLQAIWKTAGVVETSGKFRVQQN